MGGVTITGYVTKHAASPLHFVFGEVSWSLFCTCCGVKRTAIALVELARAAYMTFGRDAVFVCVPVWLVSEYRTNVYSPPPLPYLLYLSRARFNTHTHTRAHSHSPRWQFKWKAPAERFSFLKPWGDYMPVNSAPRATSYAPPRPASVLPSVHFDGGGGSDATNEGDNGTNEGDYGTNEGDYGTNEGDYGTNEGDYGTNEGDYGTTPGSEERMALSDEIGKAIGEDDFQSESV